MRHLLVRPVARFLSSWPVWSSSPSTTNIRSKSAPALWVTSSVSLKKEQKFFTVFSSLKILKRNFSMRSEFRTCKYSLRFRILREHFCGHWKKYRYVTKTVEIFWIVEQIFSKYFAIWTPSAKPDPLQTTMVPCSVADPDPSDPYVFGPPGSRSFYHQAKIVRFLLFCDFFLTFYLWKMM